MDEITLMSYTCHILKHYLTKKTLTKLVYHMWPQIKILLVIKFNHLDNIDNNNDEPDNNDEYYYS